MAGGKKYYSLIVFWKSVIFIRFCLAHTDGLGGSAKLNSAAGDVLAKWYNSRFMRALYVSCQIKHASNIHNYVLQAAEL